MNKLKPQFFELLFNNMMVPTYIIEKSSQCLHQVNPAFARLMGGLPSDIEGQSFKSFVVEADWKNVQFHLNIKTDSQQERVFQFRAQDLEGHEKRLEVATLQLDSPWDLYEIGFIKDLSEKDKLEYEISRQRENTLRAFQSTARIWHITDMIRAAFSAMGDLAEATSVDNLLEDAIKLLTSNTGLDYKTATVYLKEENRLVVAKSVGDKGIRSITLEKNGRLARIFKGQDTLRDHRPNEMVIVLKGRIQNIGLLRVMEHKSQDKEKLTEPIQRMRDSVLKTFANTLSLMISNIKLYRKVEEQAIIDPLTKVYNRRYFERKILEEIDRAARYQHPLSLIILDLDNFKAVNDIYGHLQGDKILQELGQILMSRVRKSDVVCRYGGEEFVVLLPETQQITSQKVAETIRKMVMEHKFTNTLDANNFFKVTVSIGLSCFVPQGHHKLVESTVLIKEADQALYGAKQSGRNKVVVGACIS